MSARQVVAVAIGALCVALPSTAGARGEDRAEAKLQAAVESTRHAPSYRTTAVAGRRVGSSQEYVAPDRIHTSLAVGDGSPPFETIQIGDVMYSQFQCGNSPIRWEQHTTKNPHATPDALYLLSLLDRSTAVRLTSRREDGDHYAAKPPALKSAENIKVHLYDLEATVSEGRIAAISLSQRVTSKGKTQDGRMTVRFSDYGAVPPIEAPPASEMSVSQNPCRGSLDLDLTN